jgi:hypothetical protein
LLTSEKRKMGVDNASGGVELGRGNQWAGAVFVIQNKCGDF